MELISMPPAYEKQIDVDRQRILATEFVDVMQCNQDQPYNFCNDYPDSVYEIVKCPNKYVVDYLVTTSYGKTVAVLECKWYFTSWQEYDYLQPISVHKLHHLLMLSHSFRCNSYVLIRKRDGFYYKYVDDSILSRNRIDTYGRNDRNDELDHEPMVWIADKYWDVYKVGQVNYNG
tara:strand:- start:1724 stop:2248 length:525 start_codon:yes stop_codon:yes gene_type:complete